MRSDPSQFALAAPPSLAAVLATLAADPGQHTLLAGGTELMVALGVGRLTQKSLLSIHHLRELRFIGLDDDAIHIGSGTTFTDIRRSKAIAADLPLMAQSASWTGSVANQNRGTLGGNICNASPAADTPPALLVYNAAAVLISSRGKRIVAYRDFHLGYKKTALRSDELLYSVVIPLPTKGTRHFIRKVGTRNAQAISKTALAAVALINNNSIKEIRLAAASLADRPLRLQATEAALLNRSLTPANFAGTLRHARAALATESHPIDDIRSTAAYRAAVAANLLEQFLRSLIS